MPKIKQQTAGKIGLFTAVMMIFGTLVGIGIFFKNKSVFENNHGNPTGILLSWVIAIILVMSIGLSFCEICTCKTKNKADGFGGWAQRFCGYNLGRYCNLSYSLIFYTVNTFAILFFTGEACLNCFAELGGLPGQFNFGSLTTLYVFLVGGVLFALFIILNVVAAKGMVRFSNVTGILKFVPIAAVILLGIIFGAMNGGGLWTGHWYPEQQVGNLDVVGIIGSIPSILFAFEGYLIIGNVAGDMKNPDKNVSLALVVGLIVVSTVYLLITIGCMTAGTGNVYELMTICFGEGTVAAKVCTTLLSVFIFVCIIGVLNAITFGGMRNFQAACQEGLMFKGKSLVNKKPANPLFAGGVWFAAVVGLWWVGTLIPSVILNTDQIVDAASYVMIIALYVIYIIVLVCGLDNRRTHKIEVRKNKIFPVTAVIAILGCVFMIAFCGFYKFLSLPIINAMKEGWSATYDCGWGLFVDSPFKLNYWQAILVFWFIFAFMLCSPFINDLLIKWFDKSNKESLIWQKGKDIILK